MTAGISIAERAADQRAALPCVLHPIRELITAYAAVTPVRRVAVVGNAPLPPSAARAAAIDDCDLVLRINGFALDEDGAPPCVGRRCDVVLLNRWIYATKWVLQDYRDRLYLLVEPGRLHGEADFSPQRWPDDLGWVPLPNRDLLMPLGRALGFDPEREPRWATTGTVGVWLAHQLFPDARIAVTGLSLLDDTAQRRWEHAVGAPTEVVEAHRLDLEADLIRALIARGVVERIEGGA